MFFLEPLFEEIIRHLIRGATGQLFTDAQINQIKKHSLGKYLETLLPVNQGELDRAERLSAAQMHIESASKIMAQMQVELDSQTENLKRLLSEIDEKKSLAKKYSALAATNQEAVSAVRLEIEDAIGQELIRQSNQNRTVRRTASVLLWLLTLVLGAALGAYFKDIVDWFSRVIVV